MDSAGDHYESPGGCAHTADSWGQQDGACILGGVLAGGSNPKPLTLDACFLGGIN